MESLDGPGRRARKMAMCLGRMAGVRLRVKFSVTSVDERSLNKEEVLRTFL